MASQAGARGLPWPAEATAVARGVWVAHAGLALGSGGAPPPSML